MAYVEVKYVNNQYLLLNLQMWAGDVISITVQGEPGAERTSGETTNTLDFRFVGRSRAIVS